MHITLFDRPYPRGRQLEAIAISQTVALGECNECPYLKWCEADMDFCYPLDAACMARKRALLEAANDRKRD